MKPRKATKIQIEKLQGWGIPTPETSEEAKKLIADHILEEAKKEPVTPCQAAYIRDYGEEVPATKIEASELLNRLFAGPSPKQKAKLKYFGYDFLTTKDAACKQLDEFEKDPLYRDQLQKWHLEKFDLYPELYEETGDECIARLDKKEKMKNESGGCLVMLVLLAIVVGVVILKIIA